MSVRTEVNFENAICGCLGANDLALLANPREFDRGRTECVRHATVGKSQHSENLAVLDSFE